MMTIRALVRDGRIETDEPIDLPDGTELLVRTRDDEADLDGIWDDTPEGIARWIAWYDSLEPFVFTPEERASLEAERIARREWELAHFDERAEKLRRMWE